MTFFERVARLESEKQPFALCSVIEASEHSPGRQNFKMCVPMTGDTFGSIGGGSLEFLATKEARDMLRDGMKMRISEMDLTAKEQGGIGMACGGHVKVLIECFYPEDTLYIFGGGHIGGILADFASKVGFSPVIIDNRPEYASAERHPLCVKTYCMEYDEAAKTLNFEKNAYFVIVTHRHVGDEAVLRGLLDRRELDAKYIGLIGSAKKLSTVFARMIADGYEEARIRDVKAPIGIDHGGQTASEIALAIATEIVAARYDIVLKDAMRFRKDPWSFMQEKQDA